MTRSRWTTALGVVTSALGALADPHVLPHVTNALPRAIAGPLILLGAILTAIGPSLKGDATPPPPSPPDGGGAP